MAIRTSRCLRQLSRYVPASETWQRVGSYPERREGAISAAAYGENPVLEQGSVPSGAPDRPSLRGP